MLLRYFCLLTAFSCLLSCGDEKQATTNKFSDPTITHIYDLKDRRASDSLYQYLSHENANYRREATLAFASVQDSAALDRLGRVLSRERDSTIRRAAAFAIGQTRSLHSERLILGALAKETNAMVLNELLEAYGRSTRHWQLVKPGLFHDTVKAEGLAWSIYRAGLAGKADSVANRVGASLLLTEYDEITRLGAAHYFSRSAKNFEQYFPQLREVALNDKSIFVRMAALYSLRKLNTPESLATIRQVLKSDADYRIKVNAARALQSFPFEQVKSDLYAALYDKQVNVVIAASEAIKASATKDNWIELSNLTGRITQWRAQANLYEAAIKNGLNKQVIDEAKQLQKGSIQLYQRAALLTALQNDPGSYEFLKDALLKADTAVIRTSAAAALVNVVSISNPSSVMKADFVNLVKQVIQDGDAATIGIMCGALSKKELDFKSVITDLSFLRDARAKLELPRDVESVEPIEATIAFFENREPAKTEKVYNHPIDWAFVKSVPVNQEVVIKTTKGNIKVRMLVEEAPGSVENFMKLAQSNYFDRKPFHRVVPNFVIQGGCKRGDGFGSEAYSIRSEFSYTKYKEGSVGMASAGKDTEGTQWFITHSPTPHLDGGYTIFAEVVEGMNAVHMMEISDQVVDVEILGERKN